MPSRPPTVEELRHLQSRYLPRGLAPSSTVMAERALGSQLWDADGHEYIDFTGGIGVLNVGHGHPRVLAAAHHQLDQLVHISFQVAPYRPYIQLAERLCGLAPGSSPKKALFLSTGAEAVENAVKIARAYTGRPALVAFTGAFHGRTLLTMTLTATDKPYKEGFGPFVPDVYRVPYPYQYRGWDVADSLAALERLFRTEIAPTQVAAVIIEPVLGEGGFVPAPIAFLQELRRLTERHGILLVVDEVQSGLGRTGRMFAIEHAEVEPDLITIAKSLAGGLPLSGVLGTAEVMDAPQPGALGGTFSGNPVACAAALAVLDVIEVEQLLVRAQTIGSILEERFTEWSRRYPVVGDVRVLGAMGALELVTDRDTKTPADQETRAVIEVCRRKGLLLLKAGPGQNVIRTLMPLNIPDDLLHRALDILEEGLAGVGTDS